jgi:hypothetical protein
MGMTLKEALAFRLPNGKSMGDATVEDWADAHAVMAEVAAKFEAANTRYMSEANRDKVQHHLEVVREFVEAANIIKTHLMWSAIR